MEAGNTVRVVCNCQVGVGANTCSLSGLTGTIRSRTCDGQGELIIVDLHGFGTAMFRPNELEVIE